MMDIPYDSTTKIQDGLSSRFNDVKFLRKSDRHVEFSMSIDSPILDFEFLNTINELTGDKLDKWYTESTYGDYGGISTRRPYSSHKMFMYFKRK